MARLRGQIGIVTASTKGIGLSIARRLAQDGAKVIVSSRKADNVESAVKDMKTQGLDVIGVPAHVGKEEGRKALVDAAKELGGLNFLVSNAAANPFFGPILDTPKDMWEKTFDTNVTATFELVKACLPMLETTAQQNESPIQASSVVIVASIAGYLPLPGLGCYNVTKTALIGLTKNLALELSGRRIRVNAICPGIVKTDFSQALWDNEKILKATLKQIPAGRIAEPDEMAGTASFLVSTDSEYLTGESLIVSGGMAAQRL